MLKKIKILAKYSDFVNIFSEKWALILLKITKLNQHAIELQKNWQLLYKPIFSLGAIKFKMLKTYIETILANDFI